MKVDIIVDTICPWCFIGKRRFERALAERPVPGLGIDWRPFQLNPDMPRTGMDRSQYLAWKFGDAAQAGERYAMIAETGRALGIDFDFGAIARTPNTLDSHRLIRFAAARRADAAVVEALFHAYFIAGRDIGDSATLVDIGAACGLERAALVAYLASDADIEAIRAEDEKVRDLGINGVPCFIVEGKYAVSGAQSPEVFVQIFDLATQDAAKFAAE
jgi:predicted DsbA family dithiol-disulfide isomerase